MAWNGIMRRNGPVAFTLNEVGATGGFVRPFFLKK